MGIPAASSIPMASGPGWGGVQISHQLFLWLFLWPMVFLWLVAQGGGVQMSYQLPMGIPMASGIR